MSNEEKILALLEKMEKTQEKQGEMLEQQSKILEEQGKSLEQQSKILEQHGKSLEQQSKSLEQHGKSLEQQGKILEQHGKTLEKVQDDVSSIKVRMDVEITKQLQALAEGHETLLETLAPKNRVEALEDEIVFIKSIIKAMNQEIAELKQAQ